MNKRRLSSSSGLATLQEFRPSLQHHVTFLKIPCIFPNNYSRRNTILLYTVVFRACRVIFSLEALIKRLLSVVKIFFCRRTTLSNC